MHDAASTPPEPGRNGRWGDPLPSRALDAIGDHDATDWLAPPTPDEGLRHYARIIRQRWLLVVACLVICVVAAAIYVAVAPRTYEAQTSLLVTPVDGSDENLIGLGLIPASSDPTRDVSTAATFVTDRAVAQRVAKELGGSAGEFENDISAVPFSESNLVTITATSSSARRAQEIANAFAQATVDERTARLQARLDEIVPGLRSRVDAQRAAGEPGLQARLNTLESLQGQSDPTIHLEGPATEPTAPTSPRPKVALVAGILVGLVIGVGAAFALEAFDPKVRREDAVRRLFRLPVLARIHRQRDGAGPLAPSTLTPAVYEDYRMLRASLDVHGGSSGGRSILLTGAGSAEGKSTTALNLAVVLAREGNEVILLEGDVRRPSLGTVLKTRPRRGIVSVLLGDVTIEDALIEFDDLPPNLRGLLVEESGPYVADTPVMRRFGEIILQAERLADYVVVDASPITEVSDALPLVEQVDDVIVVVRLGTTRSDRLEELGEILAHHGVRPAGVVIVGDGRRRDSAYYAAPPKGRPPRRSAPATTR